MQNISGFYQEIPEGIYDTQYDICPNSAGHYRIIQIKQFETTRINGRVDFQMIYIAKGKGHFVIDKEPVIGQEGSMILYFPGDYQSYTYYIQDSPDIYWIHFTGSKAIDILTQAGFPKTGIYNLGTRNEYPLLFNKIIKEMQIQKTKFLELSTLYLSELITLMSRHYEEKPNHKMGSSKHIEQAMEYFHRSYASNISIKDYANQCNMSCCWFIRSFRAYAGLTPQAYLTNIRITKAKELLNNHNFNISEIGEMVGYDNPFYFSRIFKQSTGIAPSYYLKDRLQNESKGIKGEIKGDSPLS